MPLMWCERWGIETVTGERARPKAPGVNAAIVTHSSAAQTQTREQMRYRAAQRNETERDFDPYGLGYREGCWYVVGMCHLRHGLRSFRLDRVLSVHLRDASFARPADFDALAHLTYSLATLPRAHAVDVVLDTDLATAQRHLFPSIGVLEWMDNAVLLRAQADDLDWFARELARLPFGFDIRRPDALRV